MPEDPINVIDGAVFLVSDRSGGADARGKSRKTDGLFCRDVRHL